MTIGGLGAGQRAARVRARSLRAIVQTEEAGELRLPKFGLKAPVVYAKTSGHADLSLNASTGVIAWTVPFEESELRQISGTATGDDECRVTWDCTLMGALPKPLPSWTVQPSISGTAQVGATLTGHDGTITAGAVSARQWLRDGAPIAGATDADYLIGEEDTGALLAYRVTASGSGGTASATSAPVGPVQAEDGEEPEEPDIPVISYAGGAFINQAGDAGQWYSDGAVIEEAIGASWTPGDMADVYGRAISQMVGGARSNVIVLTEEVTDLTHVMFSTAAPETKLSALPTPYEMVDTGGQTTAANDRGLIKIGAPNTSETGPWGRLTGNIAGQDLGRCIALQDTGKVNHFNEIDVPLTSISTSNPQAVCPVVACQDVNNFIYLYVVAGTLIPRKVIAGVDSQLLLPNNSPAFLTVPAGVVVQHTRIKLEVKQGALQASFDGIPYSFVASGQSGPADFWLPLPSGITSMGGTKIGLMARGGAGTRLAWISNHWFGTKAHPIILSITSQERSADDPNKARVYLDGVYDGIAGIEYLVMLADGTLVQDWTAGQAISGGTLAQHLDIPLTSGETYTIVARDPSVPATAITLSGTAPVLASGGDAVLGMNESSVSQWNSADPWTDLGARVQWRTPDGGYIRSRGRVSEGVNDVTTSADGEGSTVKMDMDGTIYGYNTAGLTSYNLLTPAYYTEPGDYIITLAPGRTVSRVSGAAAWSYNSGTGEITVTVPSTGDHSNTYSIVAASIPPQGIKPRIRRAGTNPVGFELRDAPKASLPQVSSILRNMSSSTINGWTNTEAGRTDTALPVDTPANVAPGSGASNNARKLLAYAEAGQGLWINTPHTAGDAFISTDAAYLASANGPVYSELSNEFWNDKFPVQNKESYLAGYRRGYGASGINTHADAAPETIIDARPYVNRSTLAVSGRAFAPGDKLFVDQNGVGYLVFSVTAAINPGDTLTPGTNATLVYGQANAAQARLKWIGRRSKEMWALQDAAFATAGKPRPIHVLAWAAVLGFNAIKPALDFDEVYKHVDRVATAPYFGNSFGHYRNAAWSQASKDKWYAGDVQGFIEDACTAMIPVVDAKVAEAVTFSNDLAEFSLEKRGNKDAIRLSFYECGQHIQLDEWPDMAGTRSTTTTYKVGAFAYSDPGAGGDGKTYRCKVEHTNQPLSDAIYWEVFVDGNEDTWDATKTALHRNSAPRAYRAAWNALSRSPEFADVLAYYFQQMTAKTGVKEIMFFDRVKAQETGTDPSVGPKSEINGWGMMLDEMDTDISGGPGTNWQFKMLKELKASLTGLA